MLQWVSSETIEWAAKLVLAHGIILVLFLLNVVSFAMPHSGDFKPFFLLMAIYYWAIYRPTLIPVPYVFILGIILDLESGLPVGLSAFIFILCKTIVQSQRTFLMGQPYVTVWIGFALISTVSVFVQWIVMSMYTGMIVPVTAILIAMGFSVLIFPLISLVLLGVHRLLPLSHGTYIR